MRVKALRLFVAAVALNCAGCAAIQEPLAGSLPQYSNPVLNEDFPDPTVVSGGDGYFYAYATQSEHAGKMVNIQVARSRDLVHWDYLGDALPAKPSWAKTTQDFWAPHVMRDGKRYLMYYSAKPDAPAKGDNQGLCLAVAVGTRAAGPFKDMGHPLKCGESFVNIDPMVLNVPGTGRLLYWGSAFQPIRVQELTPDGMAFAVGSAPRDLVSPNQVKDAFPVLVEGAWVHRRGDFYYLFYSGDNCCGAKANYAVMVARSTSPVGPFETLEKSRGIAHSIILAKRGYWFAPGHNSVVTDARGQDWIVYHAVDSRRPRAKPTDEVNTRRVVLIDRIRWVDGWPVIDGPSTETRSAPIVR